MPPKKESILKIRIGENLKDEAQKAADEDEETLSVIVRQALREYLDKRSTSKQQGVAPVLAAFNEASEELEKEREELEKLQKSRPDDFTLNIGPRIKVAEPPAEYATGTEPSTTPDEEDSQTS